MNIGNELHKRLTENGIYFTEDFIEAFFLSLKTKPFLILSGISGVGKSVLPSSIMKIVGNEEVSPIAVSPDWTDNTDMLGYFNVNNEFVIGEFTKVVVDASLNPHIPYYVILDEMNLSKVELYFAQVLSVIESRYFDENLNRVEYHNFLFNDAIRKRLQESAVLAATTEETDYFNRLYNLKLTSNIYIIGTVNVDESTYPFSKKVLDRANVLEINDVDLMVGLNFEADATDQPDSNSENNAIEPQQLDGAEALSVDEQSISPVGTTDGDNTVGNDDEEESSTNEEETSVTNAEGVTENSLPRPIDEGSNGSVNQPEDIIFINHFFEGKITNLNELKIDWNLNNGFTLPLKETLTEWVATLIQFNNILKPLRLNFGYRVRDEVCIYLYNAANNNISSLGDNKWWYKYFDQQLVQKVFTRLSGEEGEFEEVLISLFNRCITNEVTIEEIIEFNFEEKKEFVKFPQAALKLKSMIRDLQVYEKPSTSFWSS